MPELEMLDYGVEGSTHGVYYDCQACVAGWKEDPVDAKRCEEEKRVIEGKWKKFVAVREEDEMAERMLQEGDEKFTPMTVDEVVTPDEDEIVAGKKVKIEGGALGSRSAAILVDD